MYPPPLASPAPPPAHPSKRPCRTPPVFQGQGWETPVWRDGNGSTVVRLFYGTLRSALGYALPCGAVRKRLGRRIMQCNRKKKKRLACSTGWFCESAEEPIRWVTRLGGGI